MHIGTEEDSIHQLDTAAQVTIPTPSLSMHIGTEEDSIHQLDTAAQVTIPTPSLSMHIGTEEDSIHQLDTAAQVTIPTPSLSMHIGTEEDSIHQLDCNTSHNLYTENWTLSTPLPPPQTINFPFRRMSMRHRSSNPQPHPAVLPHLRRFETPDMAQSGGCPQEALGTG